MLWVPADSSKGMRYRQPWGAWQLLNRSVRLAYREGFTASRTQSMSTLRQRGTKSTDVPTVRLPRRPLQWNSLFLGPTCSTCMWWTSEIYPELFNTNVTSNSEWWSFPLLTQWCRLRLSFCSALVLGVCLNLHVFSHSSGLLIVFLEFVIIYRCLDFAV